MATSYTETYGAGAFLISKANGTQSFETVTLKSGENLKAGAVLGKVTLGAATAAAVSGNTGNGTCGAVTVGATAKTGVYTLTIIEPATNLGAFVLEDPDGLNVGNGDVGTAFTGGGLTFTLADGSTDFAAGDQFTITVAVATTKYEEYDVANTNGSNKAVAVLWADCDASSADTKCVIVARDAEVNENLLRWFSGATTNQKNTGKTELALVGIIARDGIF